jgi:hypothetical protein
MKSMHQLRSWILSCKCTGCSWKFEENSGLFGYNTASLIKWLQAFQRNMQLWPISEPHQSMNQGPSHTSLLARHSYFVQLWSAQTLPICIPTAQHILAFFMDHWPLKIRHHVHLGHHEPLTQCHNQGRLIHKGYRAAAHSEILRKIKLNIWIKVFIMRYVHYLKEYEWNFVHLFAFPNVSNAGIFITIFTYLF